jgi:cytoskeletal protein CcmA (bactofilin family)
MYSKIIFWAALLLSMPLTVFGQPSTYKWGTTVQINSGDTLSQNVLSAAQVLEIYGHLEDDLFAAARNIEMSGIISDDAIIAAEVITLNGTVGDMTLAAGDSITISGELRGDLFIAGNKIRITPQASIRGNVVIAGNEILVENGIIEGWIRIYGNDVTLGGTIQRYVELNINEISFTEDYNPLGATTIISYQDIDAETLPNAPENLTIIVEEQGGWGIMLLIRLWASVSVLIIGFLLLIIFPQTSVDLYRFSKEHYLKNTGIGLLLFLAIPIVGILLLLLFFTIPLAFLIWMLYAIALLISYLLVALLLGSIVIRYFKTESFADHYWGLVLGMALIFLLTIIPYAGPLINVILFFFGLGSLLRYFWKMRGHAI